MISRTPTNLPPHLSLKFFKIYLNAGDLERARKAFDGMPDPDLRSWTALITTYAKRGLPRESVRLYDELRKKRIKPDKFVLLSAAKACAAAVDLAKARDVHKDAFEYGFGSDLVLGNALIDMFGKCGSHEEARRVFGELAERDVISWTSLVAAYVNSGLPSDAFRVLRDMGSKGVKPNSVTLSTILPVCSKLRALNSGREIHGFATRNGVSENVFVGSGLVDMYAKCLRVRQARIVFDNMAKRDLVSWNVILSACFSNSDCEEGLKIFSRMRTEGIETNPASWNSMIGGCVQNGRTDRALDFLVQMQGFGFKPDKITMAAILPACTDLECLNKGREIHGYSVRHAFIEDMIITTALVLMYAKCGDLEISRKLFAQMPKKDTVAWNTIILANSMHGCGREALSLFKEMIDSGVKPNSVTFTTVLTGCSHSRLVDDGRAIFNSMKSDHGLEPDADHHSCMTDILSRAGRLEEAYKFIQEMPMEPTPGAWGSLLGACRVYKNADLGRIAASHLFEIEPDNPGNYVLLYNLLINSKLLDEASMVRKEMRERGIAKEPGRSWVLVRNRVYSFLKGDRRNERSNEIYMFVEEMMMKMRLAGHAPDTDFALQDVDCEEKELGLCGHSEKLAVAFGILNLRSGESSVRVFKNLRICGDCHNTIKFISRTVGVRITVRDSLRFHHFGDGVCSCGDLW